MFILLIFLQYFFIELQCINITSNDTSINKDKKALRYGFHQIHECQDFEKAFKCIRKCLDKKFDVAHADKNCVCTCYIKKDKEKYRYLAMSGKGQTPPTTRIPGWAQPSIAHHEESEDDDPKHGDETAHSSSPHEEVTPTNASVDHGGETNNTNVSGVVKDEKGETATQNAHGDVEAHTEGDAHADGEGEHKEGEEAKPEEEHAEGEHAEEEHAEEEHAEEEHAEEEHAEEEPAEE